METDRYWGVHYRYCPAPRIDLMAGKRIRRGDDYVVNGERRGEERARKGNSLFLRVVVDDFSMTFRQHRRESIVSFSLSLLHTHIHKHTHIHSLKSVLFRLLQRRHGRAALLPALEQLPVEHDVGVPPAPADRGLRRRHPGMQRGLVKGAQGRPVYMRQVRKEKERPVVRRV